MYILSKLSFLLDIILSIILDFYNQYNLKNYINFFFNDIELYT
jgi:hypothetical protein